MFRNLRAGPVVLAEALRVQVWGALVSRCARRAGWLRAQATYEFRDRVPAVEAEGVAFEHFAENRRKQEKQACGGHFRKPAAALFAFVHNSSLSKCR
jgi:hypothetical protein